MSITIIEGKPRTGKSYYLVKTLVDKYFDRDPKTNKVNLKAQYSDLKILSNIEGLKIPHENLDSAIEKAGGVSRFFSKDFQEGVYKKYPRVLYYIDESQDYFPSNFRDNNVFAWLRYHGHWGQEVVLACHGVNLLPSNISTLADSVTRTMPQSLSFLGGKDLKYSRIVSGEKLDTKSMVKRSWVFKLYKSQETDVIEKPKNPFMKYAVIIFILLIFGAWNARKLFSDPDTHNNQNNPVSTHNGSFDAHEYKRLLDEQQNKEKDELVRYQLSYLIEDSKLIIFYDGGIYDGRQFPYSLEVGPFNSFYALIPRSKLPSSPVQSNESNERSSKDGGNFVRFGSS